MGKIFIIFGTDMSSSVYIGNKNKDILFLGEVPTERLYDTTLTAEAKYSINFTQTRNRFVVSSYYNGSSRLLVVNLTKIHHFIANDSV